MSRSEVSHPVFARLYAWGSPRMEPVVAEHRRVTLAGLSGSVVEVGAGTGLNFGHYPPEVTGVLAVEPEPRLRAIARGAAEHAPVPIEVVDGRAERIPAPDEAFDAVVASLVLCSVADQHAALTEIARVVKPGGGLRFLEHVRADTPGLRRVQRILDATIWPLLNGGCHTSRDTAAAITTAGFTIEHLDRVHIPDTRIPVPFSPHIRGTAVRNPARPT